MKPLPPWHSSASCTTPTTRLQLKYFADRRADAHQQRGAGVARLLVIDRARQTEGEQGRRFDLERQVGDHVLHQRLVDQRALEGSPAGRVVDGLGERAAHQPGRADGEVEPRQVGHGQRRLDALAFLADQPAQRAAILDLARGVRLVAAFVLEALDQQAVARAVGQPAGQQEAGQAAIGMGQGDEDVAVRHREEPFVAVDQVGLARPAARRGRTRGGLRRAQIRSGLLLGQGHADGAAGLALHGAGRRVVARREDEGLPDRGELRLQAQRRNRRIGHAERTADAVLALVPEVGEHAARDVRAGLLGGP